MRFVFMTATFLLVCVTLSHQENSKADAIQDYPDEPDDSGRLVRQVRAAGRMDQAQELVRRRRDDDTRDIINQDAHPLYPNKPMENFDEIDEHTQPNWPES